MTLLSMSSRGDRASARSSKGHGFSSCRWLRSFLCPKLVSRMLISSLFNNTFFWILWNRLLRDCCLYPPPLPTISVSAVPHASIDFHIEIPSTYLWLTAPTCNQWYRNCRANRRIARTEANKPNKSWFSLSRNEKIKLEPLDKNNQELVIL